MDKGVRAAAAAADSEVLPISGRAASSHGPRYSRPLQLGPELQGLHRAFVEQSMANGKCVCVCITAVPITKLFAWGEGDNSCTI